jgi:two-component system OmpR family response regulator
MKIHIVDDNDDMANMLKQYFIKKGHECSTSNDGRNALAILQTQKFNVILLDIAMPEFSGMDIVEDLNKNNKMQGLNIVALTASSLSEVQDEQLKKKGVKAILRKPIDPDELLEYLLQFV